MGVSAVERLTPSSVEGTVPDCGFNVRYLSEALERLPDAARVHLKFSDDKGEARSPSSRRSVRGCSPWSCRCVCRFRGQHPRPLVRGVDRGPLPCRSALVDKERKP